MTEPLWDKANFKQYSNIVTNCDVLCGTSYVLCNDTHTLYEFFINYYIFITVNKINSCHNHKPNQGLHFFICKYFNFNIN